MKRNLFEETKYAIRDSGHTFGDIIFIGSEESGHRCTWDEFCKLADIEYEPGCGEIALDLIIVFKDGQKLWRGEGEGSDWWEYAKPFIEPECSFSIKTIFCPKELIGWETLEGCNEK